jgi:hypothetical protein
MEYCVCISEIDIDGVNFVRGKIYLYKVIKHEESNIDLYIVGPDDGGDTLPLTKHRFDKHFDNRQQLRERKINQILNEGDKQHDISNT